MLTDEQAAQLAADWLRHDQTGWAAHEWQSFDRLAQLTKNEPDAAWRVVLHLVRYAHMDEALFSIAAGPFEDLLVKHGEHLIARIEQEAKSDPRFLRCLSGVWGHDVDESVWDRLQALVTNMQ